MYLFQKIEEVMMNYHDARHAVGEFVLHEQKNLYKYTINEVAEYSYTSKATVVRFAKTLGFEGWRDFMKAFIAEVKYQETHHADVDANYPFHEKSSHQEIIESLKTLQMESIQDSADLMDMDMLKMATTYLVKSKHIVIFGLSPNIFLGELFRRKMISIGKKVDIANLGEMGIISRTMDEQDCAIVISYSGNNKHAEPMSYLQNLLDQKVSIIGITSGGDNYMRRILPCVFTMSSKERLYTKIANFATEESLQFILNVLYSCYYREEYQKNCLFKIQSSKILESQRNAVLNEMQDEAEQE
ncbi:MULTISPECIES: MurR/RpiR family transcriptional regulator [Erysipelotrichaceae]|uniref:MurR/RpiR family transcriptional regulator n=1 Tax=Erysipelotrichaceae TaxID=128827 RepID=UPI000E545A6E|nr:MurR/RpiR family transcriptional regulator [Absiella sp. AM27-20]RHU07577.1 MurR/RpiR family transcriptional regulator [Absiella sp. AM27-20]